MLLNFLGNSNVSSSIFVILYSLMLALFIGFFEEVVFRGFVFNFFLRKWNEKKHGIILASFASSILFGLAHFSNLDRIGLTNVSQVGSQVIYASLIGFGFCGVMLRTGSIIPLILIHAGLDAGAFVSVKLGGGQSMLYQTIGFMHPIVLTAPLALYGFMLMIQHEQEMEREKKEKQLSVEPCCSLDY
jgi:membrane protease YdiL (CAAX protease family)